MQIHRIELSGGDLGAQARFWGRTLSLPVEETADRVEVSLRTTMVAFSPAEPGEEPRYHFAINVAAGRIEDAAAWLRDHVELLPFEGGETVVRFDWIGADSLYFLDAAGNVVELMARDDLHEDDDRPFGPEHLLEVTEIGIAAEDVPATSDAVARALGADVYWGGGDGLTAVGDAVGAVLVSPVGRGWIPTGLPALPAATTIVAAGERAGRTEIPGGPYVIETVTAAG